MTPELSVIVPVLNEADTLPELFRTLAEQRDAAIELIVCDGGSTDGTTELARDLGTAAPFPVMVMASPPGRARQMNAGAAVSSGVALLFLHADSLFPDPCALRKGLDSLAVEIGRRGDERVAGRFALRFRRRHGASPWGYYHLECKARLDRRGCTHGDQGFLMRRGFFAAVGPFDGAVPMLAETRLAEAVRERGTWCLLPAEIHTSARRFEVEGLRERQTLNAIITNFAATGWEPFFREFPRLYGDHARAERLDLSRFLRRTGELMAALPLRDRLRLWWDTGRHVRDNAWQIALLLDTRRRFRRGLPPDAGRLPALRFHDRYLERLTDHPGGRLAAMILAWLWFGFARLR